MASLVPTCVSKLLFLNAYITQKIGSPLLRRFPFKMSITSQPAYLVEQDRYYFLALCFLPYFVPFLAAL